MFGHKAGAARVSVIAYSHARGCGPLHAAFQDMSYSRSAQSAQVARLCRIVLHDADPADDLQIRDLRQLGKDLFLHTIREERIFPFGTQVFERKNSQTFLCNRISCEDGIFEKWGARVVDRK